MNKIHEPTIYSEHGVTYTKKPCGGFNEYQYEWEVIKDGKRNEGKSVVYCHNWQDFLTLLDFWNHSSYKYTSVLGQSRK